MNDSGPTGGPGAGPLQGHRCGACRIEIDRGELARIYGGRRGRSAALPGVRRDPVAGQGFRSVKVVIEADGGSRGNPGPAGYGAVVWTADRSTVLAESKQAIGRATNNVAEYRGLIAGLDDAVKMGATEAAVFMDSKLVVEQMAGRWKVKHPDLVELIAQAQSLASQFRPDQLRLDAAVTECVRRPVGQRGDGRGGPHQSAHRKTPRQDLREDFGADPGTGRRAGQKRCDPTPTGARLDRGPRNAHPAADAAARADSSCRCSAATPGAATRC